MVFSYPQSIIVYKARRYDLSIHCGLKPNALNETHIDNLVDIQLGDFRVGLAKKVFDHLDAGDGGRRHFLVDLRLTGPGFSEGFGVVYFHEPRQTAYPGFSIALKRT